MYMCTSVDFFVLNKPMATHVVTVLGKHGGIQRVDGVEVQPIWSKRGRGRGRGRENVGRGGRNRDMQRHTDE